MLRTFLHAKIHRAAVTGACVDYPGSLAVDADILDAVGIAEHEKILVANLYNGQRFETYAIRAPRGGREMVLNGAAAHLGAVGDRIIIMSFILIGEADLARHVPRVVTLDEHNRIISRSGC